MTTIDSLKLMRTLDPKAITEMLKLYRVSNCLWDQTDLLYCNKDARSEAWAAILKKMKEYHPDINVDLIKRKLDNMRTAYRRELKKLIAGRQSGVGYRTSLWYFDLMSFLDGGTVSAQESRVEDAEEEENDDSQVDNDNDDSHGGGADTDSIFPTYYAEYLEDEQEPKPKKSRRSESHSMKQKIKQEEQDTSNPNISSVYLTSPDNEDPILFTEANEAVAYGKAVGLQLKELEGLQRIIAEKLISDTIFHARLNKLTPNSKIQLNSEQ